MTMLMTQVTGRNSLHDIIENISSQTHRLYHPGSEKLSHSNLSRINEDKGSIVAIDRSYNDYDWYNRLTKKEYSLLPISSLMRKSMSYIVNLS